MDRRTSNRTGIFVCPLFRPCFCFFFFLFFSPSEPSRHCAASKKKPDFFLATLLCYLLYGTPVTDKYNRHSSPRIVPDEAPCAPGLLHFFHPPPPPPPPPPAHPSTHFFLSHRRHHYRWQHRISVALASRRHRHRRRRRRRRHRCHHDRGTHTRGARELSFLLFAFFGIFPVAPSIVSRFVIVIRLHPAKRERGEGSRTGIHRTLQRQTPILLPYPPPLPPALPPPPPPTLQPSPISHPDPHPPPPSPLYPCCTLFHSLPLHLPLFRHRPRPSSLHFPFPLPSSSSQLSYRSAYPYGVPSAVQPLSRMRLFWRCCCSQGSRGRDHDDDDRCEYRERERERGRRDDAKRDHRARARARAR